MKISTSISYHLIFFLTVLFLFQSFDAQAFFDSGLDPATKFTSFYIGFLFLILHLPFVLLSFFFAVNGHLYSKKKHRDFKIGISLLWTVNSLFLAILLYEQRYVYTGIVLWGIPSLCFIMGIFRWKFPIFNWLLSTFYSITIILLMLGGIKNELGFGPRDGIYETYYASKSIKSIQKYTFGQLNGASQQFYENGQLKQLLTYQLDSLEGMVKGYYENGQLKVSYKNKENNIEGLYQSYYIDGKIATKQWFKEGILDGIQETYYPTGQLNSRCSYLAGKKEGACLVYYENGQTKNTCHYKNGVGEYKGYYENGQLKEKGVLNLDRREGPWETYHSNKVLESIGHYKITNQKHSVKDGLWKHYYPNEQLELVGTYTIGVRKGQWIKYFDTGEQSDARDYGL